MGRESQVVPKVEIYDENDEKVAEITIKDKKLIIRSSKPFEWEEVCDEEPKGDLEEVVREALDHLIEEWEKSSIVIFRGLAESMKKWKVKKVI